MSTYTGNSGPGYGSGDYVKIEVLSGMLHPISVWMRVEYCDNQLGVVYGVVDDDATQQYHRALRSGAKLAATFYQVRESRASLK